MSLDKTLAAWSEGYKHGLWQGQNCAKPAATGKPVAEVRMAHESFGFVLLGDLPPDGTRLYAAPQPAPALVPLTDAQIDQIKAQPECWEHVGQRIEFRYRPFARAIEAAHGIAAPALVPLTDEQALEIAVTATPPGSMASRHQIVEAIRLAERHHGIFPSKENPL